MMPPFIIELTLWRQEAIERPLTWTVSYIKLRPKNEGKFDNTLYALQNDWTFVVIL
jgi:hypothetical protein